MYESTECSVPDPSFAHGYITIPSYDYVQSNLHLFFLLVLLVFHFVNPIEIIFAFHAAAIVDCLGNKEVQIISKVAGSNTRSISVVYIP